MHRCADRTSAIAEPPRRGASNCPSVQFKDTGPGWVTGRALPGCHQFNLYAHVESSVQRSAVCGLRTHAAAVVESAARAFIRIAVPNRQLDGVLFWPALAGLPVPARSMTSPFVLLLLMLLLVSQPSRKYLSRAGRFCFETAAHVDCRQIRPTFRQRLSDPTADPHRLPVRQLLHIRPPSKPRANPLFAHAVQRPASALPPVAAEVCCSHFMSHRILSVAPWFPWLRVPYLTIPPPPPPPPPPLRRGLALHSAHSTPSKEGPQ